MNTLEKAQQSIQGKNQRNIFFFTYERGGGGGGGGWSFLFLHKIMVKKYIMFTFSNFMGILTNAA